MKCILCYGLLLLTLFSVGQTPKAANLCDSLLKPGKYKAAIITYDFTGETKTLQLKSLNALKANPEWADKYIVVLIEKGNYYDLSYGEYLGLSKDEYNQLIIGFKEGMHPILKDTFSFVITKKNNILSFTASKPATLLNKLKVNVATKEISFEDLKLIKELKETGTSYFMPNLNGYQAFNSQPTTNSTNKRTINSFGIYIGVNTVNKNPVLSFNYKETFQSSLEFLSICVLPAKLP